MHGQLSLDATGSQRLGHKAHRELSFCVFARWCFSKVKLLTRDSSFKSGELQSMQEALRV